MVSAVSLLTSFSSLGKTARVDQETNLQPTSQDSNSNVRFGAGAPRDGRAKALFGSGFCPLQKLRPLSSVTFKFGCVEQGVNLHRSHFGSRYKLGCCRHAGFFGPVLDSD